MEPMSSTVHMYFDFKRHLTYIRVTKMLAEERKKARALRKQSQAATRVIDPGEPSSSGELEKTHRNKSGERSKHVVVVEEKRDLLDFDCEGEIEDFGLRRRKRVYLNKSLKQVLPESLVYSLMNWKPEPPPGDFGAGDVTRPRIGASPKYVDLAQDSRFFLRDCFGRDWESQSEILGSNCGERGSGVKTLPYEYARRMEETKSETLMDLNAILNTQNGAPVEGCTERVESFMVERAQPQPGPEFAQREKERAREREKEAGKAQRKKKVKWEEPGAKKEPMRENSFYKIIKLKDIELFMKRTQTREGNRRLEEKLMEKIKNKKISEQLKVYSGKVLRSKNLFKKKFHTEAQKRSLKSPKTRPQETRAAEREPAKGKRAESRRSQKGKQPLSVSKKGSRKRVKGKRTNSEAIEKPQQTRPGGRRGAPKVAVSEVLGDVRKKSRLSANQASRRKKGRRRNPSELEVLMTAGSNKLAPRRDPLRLSKCEVNKRVLSKRTAETLLLWGEKSGGTFEAKKKSLRLAEEVPGIFESLAESGLASVDVRFKSTKKKLGRADFEFNMKRLSNTDKIAGKALRSPEKRRRKAGLQRQLNVKLRKPSREHEQQARKVLSSLRRVDAAGDASGRRKLKLGSNLLTSAQMEAALGLKEQLAFFERKSINCRSQKGPRRREWFAGAPVKSKEKLYRRRQSEKNILAKKENSLAHNARRGPSGKSSGLQRKKSRPKETCEREASRKSRRKKKREEAGGEQVQLEMWGPGKKRRSGKKLETDARARQKAKRERLEKEIFRKLGDSKFQMLLKSQRVGQAKAARVAESLAEKTLQPGLARRKSSKFLGKLNFELLSKKKPRKKHLKSLSKALKKGLLRSKQGEREFFFDPKTRSTKKKREMTMQ